MALPSNTSTHRKSLIQKPFERFERSPRPYNRQSLDFPNDDTVFREREIPVQHDSSSPIRRSTPADESGGSSDAETDKDNFSPLRALPAPQQQPKKGLRSLKALDLPATDSPFLSPSQLHDEDEQPQKGYFERREEVTAGQDERNEESERRGKEKFVRRRRAELLRRISECFCLALLCTIVITENRAQGRVALIWPELSTAFAISAALFLLYPVRLLLALRSKTGRTLRGIRLPSTFDPAPLLYPPLLPGLISMSIHSHQAEAILPNIVLGLSTLPKVLIPRFRTYDSYDACHWLLTLMPVMTNDNFLTPSTISGNTSALDAETLSMLFPLHQALLSPLYYLTTSSLLPTELQLLSIALINVLLVSSTPQALIQRALFWVGGLSIFILCSKVVRQNVALERIPTWRSQRAQRASSASQALHAGVHSKTETSSVHDGTVSHQEENVAKPTKRGDKMIDGPPPTSMKRRSRHATYSSSGEASNGRPTGPITFEHDELGLRRIQTLPAPRTDIQLDQQIHDWSNLSSAKGIADSSSTPQYVTVRKILYTAYIYVSLVAVVLGPVRLLIGQALQNWEPIGWAVGYLFGDLPGMDMLPTYFGLSWWVPLTKQASTSITSLPLMESVGWVDQYRQVFGPSNVRLLLFAYWALVIALGLFTVLRLLSEFAEVDTRRKVFHGMMVVMLLPTTFIDPSFLALALSMVLAVFLLLEVIRASQIRPLARPLARFITPYIDGRDLRGPVVVSHIFLLIGCAFPLWLSLASYSRNEDSALRTVNGRGDPWAGWELVRDAGPTRDLSMVAGVICVGMGDSAASLIGRRYGKHKWPWAGGKSLEGSGAFALAVTAGLLLAKLWLQLGEWQAVEISTASWLSTLMKMTIAASGASFTEAVLTGANDNVVVPITLWLLVRSLNI